jgi:hypothetical protein
MFGRQRTITYLVAIAAIALLLMIVSGCDEEDAVTDECDVQAASIIPDVSGKPQHIYFYSPT